jgi:hypothetical protein
MGANVNMATHPVVASAYEWFSLRARARMDGSLLASRF